MALAAVQPALSADLEMQPRTCPGLAVARATSMMGIDEVDDICTLAQTSAMPDPSVHGRRLPPGRYSHEDPYRIQTLRRY